MHNDVPQGLCPAIFTHDMRNMEAFLAHRGSNGGIVNAKIGTYGAEIGGACTNSYLFRFKRNRVHVRAV